MSKITYNDVVAAMPKGWKVVSEQYVNLDTEMQFECPQGHQLFLPWKKLRNHFDCPNCELTTVANDDKACRPKPRGAKRVLALDQASHTTGYAIFDDAELVTYGIFNTELSDEIARDNLIKQWFKSMVTTWRPDHVAFEGIQLQDDATKRMGVTTFETLARLQGILMEAAFEMKIAFEVCPSNSWRHYCGVRGTTRTDRKRSMQALVYQWYEKNVTNDEADAIGIGYYMSHNIIKNNTIENWES